MATTTEAGPKAGKGPLSPEELARIDAWWRAANYLSVGQIYLLDNPLLREPLLLELAGGQPEGISGPVVTMGAVAGDPVALASFAAVGAWLGHGLADLAAVLDPRTFIIGGGVAEAGELLVGPAREAFQAGLTGRGHRPTATVRVAELGQDAGLIGAADLARR